MIHAITKGKRRILRYSAFVFLILSLFYFGFSTTVQYNTDLVKGQGVISRNNNFIQSAGAIITSRLSRIVSDLLYTKESFQIIKRTYTTQNNLDEIAMFWRAFTDKKKIYDQIRFLDLEGNEQLRVNYAETGSYITPQSELQNKKDRYYFSDAIHLPENRVYISGIDLNIENGQIETPVKPTIRFATPVFTADHQRMGLIVMNYYADDLFRSLKSIISNNTGALYMLNSDGYWLFNSEDRAKEWTFMYPEKSQINFTQPYPEEWDTIRQVVSGTLTTDHGAFVFGRVFTAQAYQVDSGGNPPKLGSGDWYLVSRIPLESNAGQMIRSTFVNTVRTSLIQQYYVYLMILFISIVIAVLLVVARTEREKVKFFSEYDMMTGALNRRAGLERLSKLYIGNPDRRCQISICFVDINGLKEVNDTLGHEVGDELICTVTDVTRKAIRANDLLIRLGGDEFLIVFEGLDEAEAEKAWVRVVEAYDAVNRSENRRYIISVSHGIENYLCNSTGFIDTIINRADAKMYEEKRRMKRDLHVICNNPEQQRTTDGGEIDP